MYLALGLLAGLIVLAAGLRQWLLHQECPQRHSEPFEGTVYQAGKAAIAERRCDNPHATVICMHGFVEDMRYFTEHYGDPGIQLILLTSCDYHVPISAPRYQSAPWLQAPSAPEGSIPYDAAVLVQALEHLPRTDTLRVHGHSRGGAVILEAAAMRPDLFSRVEVLLEAPVLPQGRSYRPPSAVELWLFAFVIPAWRKNPINPRNRGAWGALENARKREIITSLPYNVKHVSTLMANLRWIDAWMKERDFSIYQHVQRGTVIVPGRDRVLDVHSMRESARQAAPRLELLELEGCSHFPLFDRPDAIPPLTAPSRTAAASAS